MFDLFWCFDVLTVRTYVFMYIQYCHIMKTTIHHSPRLNIFRESNIHSNLLLSKVIDCTELYESLILQFLDFLTSHCCTYFSTNPLD